VVGYGAPGKGNTLLNYCGIRTDFLDYTVDRSPHKQNTFTPGTHIPIHAPERIRATRPDYVFILPWNLKDEIMQQMSFIREWGGRFVVPIRRCASMSSTGRAQIESLKSLLDRDLDYVCENLRDEFGAMADSAC
jgi:hypothetical protein